MSTTVKAQPSVRQAIADDPQSLQRSTAVDQALVLLRQAVSECGWTLDALAVEMGKDKAYIHRVLNREKPLTLEFMVALPDDVEALYEAKRAEQFGHVVVAPLAGADALKALVAGLVGVMAGALPTRATQMARAALPIGKKSEVA